MIKKLVPVALCAVLVACAGDEAGTSGVHTADAASGGASTAGMPATAARATASFQAHLAGAYEGSLEGSTAISGARFGRYHVSLAGNMDPGPGLVLLSLARDDTASPGTGTYQLGEAGGFDGNIEIGAEHRDFHIESGSLVITRASGDALEGTISLQARERAPATGGAAGLQLEATFKTTPAG